MREAPEYLSFIQAAERAAEGGDYASAENLLRDAARVQEATLGPRHPDLANTLNNLGVVCEITGKPDDAEQYFRRAVSIARTSLAPDHPFVATSQKNLRDFCETRGRKVEQPAPRPVEQPAPTLVEQPAPIPKVQAPAPMATADRAPVAPVAIADPAPAATAGAPDDPERTSRKLFGRLVLGALGPIAMLMVVLSIGLPKLGAPELAAPLPEFAVKPPHAAPPDAAPPNAAPRDEAPPEDVAPEEIPPPAPAPVEASIANIATVSTPARTVVVRASLCGDLDDWLCDPADRPAPPGPLFFYTQIKSTHATTVQHRWYRDDRLLRSVELRVQANTSGGFRTYSRQMMTSDSAGSWRVELRSEDGALLHEERFTVQ